MLHQKTCLSCTKLIRKKHKRLKCSLCGGIYHQKCTSVTPSQFIDTYEGKNAGLYRCEKCPQIIINDEVVQSNTYDFQSLQDRITVASQNKLIMGPTETADLYLSIDDLNCVLKSKKQDDIYMIHVNAVSWVKNFDSFIAFFENMKHFPDVICVSETRIMDKKIDWQLLCVQIANYELNYDNSPSDAGGVAIYVKKGKFDNYTVKKDLRLNVADCESIFLEVKLASKITHINKRSNKLLLGCIYRHPRTTLN